MEFTKVHNLLRENRWMDISAYKSEMNLSRSVAFPL